jgi:glycosyltransferase involved in cell wall biosynthesis
LRTSGKPRVLFLCQTLPFPPDGGVHLRTYNVMRLLSRHYDVTAICFFRKATRPTPDVVAASTEGLRRIGDVQAFPIPQEHSRIRALWDHARSVLRGTVYTRFVYDSIEFRDALRNELARKSFHLVHLDSMDLSRYLPELRGLPIVCTHHNIESDLLRRRARTEAGVRGRYLAFQGRLMAREEARWCNEVDLNITVSRADAARLKSIAPGARIRVVPNGVDCDFFTPDARDVDAHRVVFVGGYTWYPNRDAMEYMASEVMPILRRLEPSVRVTWVGRPPPDETSYTARAIDPVGFVDDVRPYVWEAGCFIAPLRVGGGTRLKILDAMAMGKAIVSTSVASEGIEVQDGRDVLIADTPRDFANAVHLVLRNPDLRNRLGRTARETAQRLYDWRVIGEDMNLAYRELIDARHPQLASV